MIRQQYHHECVIVSWNLFLIDQLPNLSSCFAWRNLRALILGALCMYGQWRCKSSWLLRGRFFIFFSPSNDAKILTLVMDAIVGNISLIRRSIITIHLSLLKIQCKKKRLYLKTSLINNYYKNLHKGWNSIIEIASCISNVILLSHYLP